MRTTSQVQKRRIRAWLLVLGFGARPIMYLQVYDLYTDNVTKDEKVSINDNES